MELSWKLGGWITAFGGAVSYLFGGWTVAFEVLLLFVSMDVVTGVARSFKEKKIHSRVGQDGILRKVQIFFLVAVAYGVDRMVGDGTVFRDATIMFYVVNEGISIIENAGQMGLPIPDKLQNAFEVLKEKE